VIDELPGHAGGRRPEQDSGMGRVYQETIPKMRRRVAAAIETRLAVVLNAAGCEAAGGAEGQVVASLVRGACGA
jgi:hypothetical protein